MTHLAFYKAVLERLDRIVELLERRDPQSQMEKLAEQPQRRITFTGPARPKRDPHRN